MIEQQLQQFVERMQGVEQQLQLLHHQLQELEQVHEAVGALDSVSESQETLIPLGAGIFAKGKVTDTSKVFMNVGAKTVVEKPLKEAQKKVAEQKQKLTEIGESMQSELRQLKEMVQMMQMQQAQKASEKTN